jgi:uncharacterized repeat protein (TIGR02543 family)
MSKCKLRSLFTKKRLFSFIIPIAIIVIFVSIFAFTNFSKADTQLTNRLAGKILLQTEGNGEAWYLDPDSKSRLFLNRPADAYNIMRNLGLGIRAEELDAYLDSSFPKRLAGRILLSVEEHGEAYYINPDDLKGYYLGTPEDAFTVMKEQSLGISNEDLDKIAVYKDSNDNKEEQSSSDTTNTSDNEETELSIETITPEPVYSFSNIMTVFASLNEDKVNIDNIKEWGMVWDYNNIPEVEMTPTLDDNYRRLSGDINQIKNKEEKLSLNIVGLLPSTYPYIRSYLILEDDSVIYGETKVVCRYITSQGGLIDGGFSSDANNIIPGTPKLPHVSSLSIPVYEVSYQSGDNGSLTGETTQFITSGGDTTIVTAVPDTGYSFSGWSDGVTDNPRTDTNVTANISVTANFAINTYTVTFQDYDTTELKTETVDHGSDATAPTDPTRTGYTFTGWDIAYTNVTSNLTVIAQYIINTYTVTFDGNGSDGGSTATQTLDYNTPTNLTINGYTRNGYTFVGWNTIADGTGIHYVDAASYIIGATNVILYAQWCADETITYNSLDYKIVGNNKTGKCWLDRNLGASRVAENSTDSASYGDLFQWGRLDDGHQLRTSNTTTTLSTTDNPGHSDFIINHPSPYDWRSPQNDNLWQVESGVNNPCPTGFRIPTEAELIAEMNSWGSNDYLGAFASPLKWSLAGLRNASGDFYHVDDGGYIWSSSVSGIDTYSLSISSTWGVGVNITHRVGGLSVRCIRD